MASLPKVKTQSPPLETEQNTVNVHEGRPHSEAQGGPPSEIELQTNHTSLSTVTVSGRQELHVDIHPDGTLCFQSMMTTANHVLLFNNLHRTAVPIYMQAIEDYKLRCIPGGIQTQNHTPAGMYMQENGYRAHILALAILRAPTFRQS